MADVERTKWVGTPEAAAYLGVHPETIRRWAVAGTLKGKQTPGGLWRFRVADLDAVYDGPEEAA